MNIISKAFIILTGAGLAALIGVAGLNLYAVGRVISVTDVKTWIKDHPEVDPNTMKLKNGQTTGVVKVTTVQQWLKEHPNVDPKNIKKFDPPVKPAGFQSLTPMLTWKNPPATETSSILLVDKTAAGQTILEVSNIMGESYTVPANKLNYNSEYVWQIAHITKSTEIIDGGTFKFVTNKPPAPKLK